MKSTRIVFKLTPYQLARGLQVIRKLEPNYKLISLNDIVKTIYHDYLAKMTINRLDEIPASLMAEITSLINKPAKEQITLEELINLRHKKPSPKSVDPEPEPAKSETLSKETIDSVNKIREQLKASSYNDPNETTSKISSLTDFSPPKDWME